MCIRQEHLWACGCLFFDELVEKCPDQQERDAQGSQDFPCLPRDCRYLNPHWSHRLCEEHSIIIPPPPPEEEEEEAEQEQVEQGNGLIGAILSDSDEELNNPPPRGPEKSGNKRVDWGDKKTTDEGSLLDDDEGEGY